VGDDRIHAQQGQVGPVAQDADVDRIEHGHGQNAGQQVGHLEPIMDGRGDKSGQHPAGKCQEQSGQRVHPAGQRGGHNHRAHGEAAVHGQVREIENTEGEKHPQGHDGVDQPFDENAFKHDGLIPIV
jgi:hypothetical protein